MEEKAGGVRLTIDVPNLPAPIRLPTNIPFPDRGPAVRPGPHNFTDRQEEV